MSVQTKPIIAIPMGDPAGIGPEITVKALNNPKIYEVCSPLVIGHSEVLKMAMNFTSISLNIRKIKDPSDGKYEHGTIDVISLNNVNVDTLEMGKVQAQCGKAAYEYIETAVHLALNGKVSALATTPINKESLKAANVPFIGHTEILAALTNTHDPLTMFEVRNMRIFF